MYKAVFIFLFFTLLIDAQNKRFVYEYSFAEDSTHLDIQKKEFLNLDIGKEGSKFYASEFIEQDSLVKIKERPMGKYPYEGIKFLNVIIKNYPALDMIFYTNCLGYYKLNLNKKLDWQIFPEIKKILGYSAQKATTTLYKRKWTVWFTTEIPVQDGPYFFQGLPGLIIKAEDQSNSVSFNLVEIKSLNHFEINEIPYFFRLETVKINENELKKIIKNFYDNPTLRRNNEPAVSSNHVYFDSNGKEVSSVEFYRTVDKGVRNALKKSNNLLRYDMIK